MKKMTMMLAGGLLMLGFAQAQNKKYSIKADIQELNDYTLSATIVTGMEKNRDTPTVKKGEHVEFNGNYNSPSLVMMSSTHPSAKFSLKSGGMFIPAPPLEFFITEAPVTITGDANELFKSKVTGGKLNAEYNGLKEQTLPLIARNWEIRKTIMQSRNPADSNMRKSLSAEQNENAKKIDDYQTDFVKKHPQSYVSVILMSRMFDDMPLEHFETLYNQLSANMKATPMGKALADRIKGKKTTAVGAKAPVFSKPDINGNMFTLASQQGKYVLIDFWGSWCGPCRAGNPHLKTLYAKYKDKGFEIVGIADEKNNELNEAVNSWKQAVEKDGLPWINVLNNFDKHTTDLVSRYAINGFPTKLLLDKNGTVIFREVGSGGEELDKMLVKIFGE